MQFKQTVLQKNFIISNETSHITIRFPLQLIYLHISYIYSKLDLSKLIKSLPFNQL